VARPRDDEVERTAPVDGLVEDADVPLGPGVGGAEG